MPNKPPRKPEPIEIICTICGNKFIWTRPKGQGGWAPTICGTQDEKGKFIPDPKCNQLRNVQLCRKSYDKNYRNRPGQEPIKWPKQNTKKAVPIHKTKVKRYCQYPSCRRITAQRGINYFYCQYHWDLVQDRC